MVQLCRSTTCLQVLWMWLQLTRLIHQDQQVTLTYDLTNATSVTMTGSANLTLTVAQMVLLKLKQ